MKSHLEQLGSIFVTALALVSFFPPIYRDAPWISNQQSVPLEIIGSNQLNYYQKSAHHKLDFTLLILKIEPIDLFNNLSHFPIHLYFL